ncbi:MAG: glycosyltransferase family 4 protein [Armatimonadetes bacterium]|nr:glycosyltransferase family 4 protein [Armatimonadota bacterium]
MRIAFVNTIRAWGGGEKWLLTTALGLRERGHTVSVICHPGSALEAQVTASNLPVHSMPIPSDVSVGVLLRLAGLFRGLRPDVVVCCNERAGRVGAPAARLGARARVIYRNGLSGSFKNRRHNRWVSRWAIDHFAVNAAATQAEMLSFGWIAASRVTVIYNGIDATPFRAACGTRLREEWAIPRDGLVVAVIGRLVADKGIADALPAFSHLAAALPGVRVVIAGEGPERSSLETAVAARGLAGTVRFLGPRTDIPDVLAAADLLVHPSRREGAPNVVLEAMAARRPVVATACAGTPELVADGETGFLVPIGDAAALVERVERLARDPDLRREMGEAAAQRVEAEFSPERALDRWEALLARVAEKRR